MSVGNLFLRAASARGLGAVNSCLQAPRRRGLSGLGWGGVPPGFTPAPVATPSPVASAMSMSPQVAIGPEYRPELLQPVAASTWYDSSGNLKETDGSGGGFWSSLADAAGKVFTGALNPQQGYLAPPVQPPSMVPWIIGGVAVVGLGIVLLTRKK